VINLAFHNKLGKLGEQIACNYLLKMKYSIIEQNHRNKFGEIDIIARQKNILIFVEVKSRSSEEFVNLNYSLRKQQIKHLKKAGNYYFIEKKLKLLNYRYDLILLKIDCKQKQVTKFRHLKNIIN
jgi:putative endonuclease